MSCTFLKFITRVMPLLVLMLSIVCSRSVLAATSPCTVSGVLYRPNGSAAANETLTIVKAEQNGMPLDLQSPQYTTLVVADQTGFVRFTVPQGSLVWLQAMNVIGFDTLGGVPVLIPNQASASLETLWHVPEGVTSLNGQTGDLSLPISDARLAIQAIYGGSGASSTLTLAGSSNSQTGGANIVLNGNGEGNVLVGGSTDAAARLSISGSSVPGTTAVRINKGDGSSSALDIYTTTTNFTAKAVQFLNDALPPLHVPQVSTYINTVGAFYTRAWMVISGHANNGSGDDYAIIPPSTDPFMLGIWADVFGPALQVRGLGNPDSGSYLFSGLDHTGKYTFSIEVDGKLQWGATTRAAMDTNLYRSTAGTLKTDGNLAVNGNLLLGTSRIRSMVRDLPLAVGSAVDIGSFQYMHGTGILAVTVVALTDGYSVSKHYMLPMQYNSNPNNQMGSWVTALPTASTPSYKGNDFELDVNTERAVMSLRLRTTATGGVSGVKAFIMIQEQGLSLPPSTDTFTASTAVTTVSAPTQTFAHNAIAQIGEQVGIRTATPANDAALDINGGDSMGLRLRPRSTSGHPTTGTWSKGTIILDADGDLYICTAAGQPGTWRRIVSQ
jgi:hypothetical protein